MVQRTGQQTEGRGALGRDKVHEYRRFRQRHERDSVHTMRTAEAIIYVNGSR
jgi:hypothetical protein